MMSTALVPFADEALAMSPTSLMSPDQFCELLNVDDPCQLMGKFWKNLDVGETVVIDEQTLRWLGYRGTLNKQRAHFRHMLNTNAIPYEILKSEKAKEYPVLVDEVAKVPPRNVASFEWIALHGRNFKFACFCAQPRQAKHIFNFYINLETAFRQYGDYVKMYNERSKARALEVRDAKRDTQHRHEIEVLGNELTVSKTANIVFETNIRELQRVSAQSMKRKNSEINHLRHLRARYVPPPVMSGRDEQLVMCCSLRLCAYSSCPSRWWRQLVVE